MAIKEGTSNHSAAYLGPIVLFEFSWPLWPYHSIIDRMDRTITSGYDLL